MSTYKKVNETTLKISTVVEQEVTYDQIKHEKEMLTENLVQLEQQYKSQKDDIMARIENVDKALAEADKMKLKGK